MSQTAFTAPHHAVADIGLELLEDGASAVDAMIAASAAIAVAYPHMNSLGGDGFWLIWPQGGLPVAVNAAGVAARESAVSQRTERDGTACITTAGAIAGWAQAQQVCDQPSRGLGELLAPAIKLAEHGLPVTSTLASAIAKCEEQLCAVTGFAECFMPSGAPLRVSDQFRNPAFADFLRQLAEEGVNSFYKGNLAAHIVRALNACGSPLTAQDFANYQARSVAPLSLSLESGQLYNFPLPTQGFASLLILGIFERLQGGIDGEADTIHALVEATKQAFVARDKWTGDALLSDGRWRTAMQPDSIDAMAAQIEMTQARPWPFPARLGDTVWMGALDRQGTLVSYIQSLYWEFGSGVVIPDYGLLWNNRGLGFSEQSSGPNQLAPGAQPFHTLNPAAALLPDGRRMVYGTMGGEGQPQTQAALFVRYVLQGLSLQDAISNPRWLLGRTWGDVSQTLKVEARLADTIGEVLTQRGHDWERVTDFSEMMGHAGAIVLHSDGHADCASDPRSDGAGRLGSA